MYAIELVGTDDAFAARECAVAASDVTVVAPGLATARGVDESRFQGLALGRSASRLVARTDATLPAAEAALEAASFDRDGSIAVRARVVRGSVDVSTAEAERRLGNVLVSRGFTVDLDDPDHELRALFADDTCLLGWLAVESRRDFDARAPTDKPFFTPGSMDPMLARAVVNLAGAGTGVRIVDPMCGTGGVLLEAALLGTDVIGVDAQRKMVAGAHRNLTHYLERDTSHVLAASPGTFHLGQGDATRLPLPDDVVDAAVFDVPYGRQSRIEGEGTDELSAGALQEARRVARRAVVVADRSLSGVAEEAGWEVPDVFVQRVHRSLDRHVHVLVDR